MDFWDEFLKSIDDLKLGFFVALALGFGLYRLSKVVIKPETTTNDNDMVSNIFIYKIKQIFDIKVYKFIMII